jgi:transcriptional regulator of acetoin/glycerol metabolism
MLPSGPQSGLLSAEDRLSRARVMLERRGLAAQDLLPRGIAESWQRCLAHGLDPQAPPPLAVVGTPVLEQARERAALVRRLALGEMDSLYHQIAGTNFMIAFADADGLLLDTICDGSFQDTAHATSIRPGTLWGEAQCGTNALGTVVQTRAPATVHGGEHFFRCHTQLTCIAVPVFAADGALAGVLDASSDCGSRQRHTQALVAMAATQIENGLFRESHHADLVIAFHSRAEFVHTLSTGLLAVDADGLVRGANARARFLLAGLPIHAGRRLEDLFRSGLADLLHAAGDRHRLEDRVGSVFAARLEGPARPRPVAAPALAAPPAGAPTTGVAPLSAPASAAAPIGVTTLGARALAAHQLGASPGAAHPTATRRAAASLPVTRTTEANAAPPAQSPPAQSPPARSPPAASPPALGPAANRPGPLGPAHDFVAEDPAVLAALAQVEAAARRGLPILIRGATGTGKEHLARHAHRASGRSGAFVPVNCAGLPDTLVEAELFGHADGAFTGARRGGAAGLVMEADGGTLFLDEIGDMKLALQAVLLRLLDDWTVRPVGGGKRRRADVLLLAATNVDLEAAVAAGRFRADLLYRINMVDVTLPPLHQRRDFAAVARHLLAELAPQATLSPEAAAILARRPWPGNMRQLRGELMRLTLTDATRVIDADLLGDAPPPPGLRAAMAEQVRAVHRELEGNIARTARRLGVSRNTVYRALGEGR